MSIGLLMDLYNRNKNFKTYVDTYCKRHNANKETAFKNKTVIAVAKNLIKDS